MMATQAPRLPGSVTGRMCPIGGCGRTVRPGHLMCAPHWREVPTSLRTQVWGAWRAFQRSSSDADWDQYMHLREKALEHFEPAEDPLPPSESVTLADLDDAALVLVVAPDGSTRIWWGDRDEAAAALLTAHTQLTEET